MYKRTHRKNGTTLLATIAALSLLAACGGEEGGGGKKESTSSSGSGAGGLLVCIGFVLVSGNDDCLGWGSGSPTNLGGFDAGSQYVINYDVEPNNDWMNSNYLNIGNTTKSDGFIVDGEVSDISDSADTFSFSRRTGRNFRFKLCAPSQNQCTEYGEVDTLTAYIDILDSNGRVIVSSQAANRNFVSTRINAGLTYYVRIAAGDTMASTVGYKLMAQEYE